MKGIIIYGSKYGSAEKYANELGRLLCFDVCDHSNLETSPNSYDTIIYGGSLYAGKVIGLEKTLKKFPDIDGRKLIIFTVGLRDPQSALNVNEAKGAVAKALQSAGLVYFDDQVFLLRGRMKSEKLNFVHRMMMKYVHSHPEKIMADQLLTDQWKFLRGM